MVKQIINFLLSINIVILFLSSTCMSWDNEKTHKDLSFQASKFSKLGTGVILENIGLKGALKESFKLDGKTKQVIEWLQEGAKLEDAGSNWDAVMGNARFNNHFHNPLKLWPDAGLNDYINIPNPYPPYIPIKYSMTGKSGLEWSQDSIKQKAALEGDWAWQTTRDRFYYALTSKTDSERQANFAQTFRGLGHQMHLIQDMAVPAHVRNDAHPRETVQDLIEKYSPIGDLYFENWAKSRAGLINDLAANPVFPQVDLAKSFGNMAPITQFYDTDQYNENVVPTNSLTWGLAEYTNANFVSDDTIFTENFNKTDRHYHPYPRYTDNTQCYEQYEEKVDLITSKSRTYWRKKCNGETVDHCVQVGALFQYLPTWDLQRLSIHVDEKTHYDYVSKLIPRAVGYSAGLLNYFFRGDINLIYDPSSSIPGYRITNNSSEQMSGMFEIYYDNSSNERVLLIRKNLLLAAANGSPVQSEIIEFNAPEPDKTKEQGKYIVVFRGKMGSENCPNDQIMIPRI